MARLLLPLPTREQAQGAPLRIWGCATELRFCHVLLAGIAPPFVRRSAKITAVGEVVAEAAGVAIFRRQKVVAE